MAKDESGLKVSFELFSGILLSGFRNQSRPLCEAMAVLQHRSGTKLRCRTVEMRFKSVLLGQINGN
jgi:hypothetical protein